MPSSFHFFSFMEPHHNLQFSCLSTYLLGTYLHMGYKLSAFGKQTPPAMFTAMPPVPSITAGTESGLNNIY